MKDTITKPCEYCGTPVTRPISRHAQRKYWVCGRSCAGFLRVQKGAIPGWQPNRFRGLRETRNCAQCGKPITRYVTEQNHDQAWKCSRVCTALYQAGRPRSRSGQDVPCGTCGKLVYRAPGQTQQRYCSPDCAHAAHVVPLIEKPCAYCGTILKLRPSEAATRYCSRECTTLGKVKRPTGRMHNGKPVRVMNDGYVKLWEPTHPHANRGWVLEHRWIMEQQIGRILDPSEEVDHINTIRSDNDPKNLQVLDKATHRKKTGSDARKARLSLRERIAQLEAELAQLKAQPAP